MAYGNEMNKGHVMNKNKTRRNKNKVEGGKRRAAHSGRRHSVHKRRVTHKRRN